MRQKHGQNFLIDNNIANNIIKAAELTNEDNVLEIGPGKGVLTKLIQPKVKHLTAVEIDPALSQKLNYYYSFHNINNIEIITADFLKLNIDDKKPICHCGQRPAISDLQQDCGSEAAMTTQKMAVNSTLQSSLFTLPFKVISNLPYNVGTAIIQKILPMPSWTQCVLMLQKEVIERLAANPDDDEYGYISLFTQYYANREILFDVSPKCFNPPPKVISSVIKLTNKNSPEPNKLLFPFIKHAFSQRRKTILNSLSSFANIDKIKAAEILKSCSLDPMLRPEKLSLSDFVNLTEKLYI
ncbi:MAG: 16S rRNA (adenine(1518)-N(6)/adenine(1519)-N(6))-dimethyltransferase [Endomicrobia bacterium]|nr:16S rRNA (adenine(1518)-N(6)/adenine(1519)-N(6))-dimethyltransferase [Endomicrobiia bacterium]MCL2506331.1 16S rRNA (adenine(1518)-N(6)/adenine(1519)-N(6))-dimethyltransferase [Endomicrobiia bacterium]